jgi:hypothetical protein
VGNMGIGTNACENCLIENNVVIHEQPFGQTSIAVPDRDRDDSDLPMTDVTVRNNTVLVLTDESGNGIRVGGEGTNHVVVSNAVHYAGASDGYACFDLTASPDSYAVSDNNLCYLENAPGANWESSFGDLASWQATSGHDAASLDIDPELTNTLGPDFDLAPSSATSPLVGNGHPDQSSPTDITGQPRDDAPDIGAYEYRE